ncbi:MAG: hypothetical protein ACO3FE_14275, partial [Planctomycetaceae bacterium]
FFAVLYGDVSGNWEPAVMPAAGQPDPSQSSDQSSSAQQALALDEEGRSEDVGRAMEKILRS